MIKKISFEHWLGRQRDEAYKEGARVQAEMDAEAMSKQRQEIVEEIEKTKPVTRGESKWIMHPDWISKKELLAHLKKKLR